jgi:hypothetical protein
MSRLVIDGERIPLTVDPRRGRVIYASDVPVPAVNVRIPVRIDMATGGGRWRPSVTARAPECLRHRFDDGTLCLWFDPDGDRHRWTISDGVEALVHHVRRHLFQEACCRAGEPWPGAESPGAHPRPTACRTCGGEGP